jgi:hypothetical protein
MSIAQFPKDYDRKKHGLFYGKKYRTSIEKMPNVEEATKAVINLSKAFNRLQEQLRR